MPTKNASETDLVIPGVSVRGISKRFAGQVALDNIFVDFRRGKVTALLGHNGSGKSTLIKILAGYHQPDHGGEVWVGAEQLPLPAHPKSVHAKGVRFVHQDPGLVLGMTVADNFAFDGGYQTHGNLAPINGRAQTQRVSQVLHHLGLEIDPSLLVGELDGTAQTMVAIARALQDQALGRRDSLTLVLDEPTATLPHSEVDRVFSLLRTARELGTTIIYVTHRLDEVTQLADDVVVLRDGAVAEAGSLAGRDVKSLALAVTGGVDSEVDSQSIKRDVRTKVRLAVDNLSGEVIRAIDLRVHEGEILGIAGFMGSGLNELTHILSGAKSRRSGSISLDGVSVNGSHPREYVQSGICYVSSDRRHEACVVGMSLRENLTLGDLKRFWKSGRFRFAAERDEARALIKRFAIYPAAPDRLLSKFSGGNQQKAVLAKNICLSPSVLILDEPTQGVDVGARRQIHQILRGLAGSGASIIVASTDLEELLDFTDRILVLDRGRLRADVTSAATSLQQLTRFCNGEES